MRQEDLPFHHERRLPRQPQPGERFFEFLRGTACVRGELGDHTPTRLLAVAVAAALSQPSTAQAQAVGPDLTIAMSHSGTFTVGVNGTYTIVVSNIGGMASSGPITVSDLLNPNANFGSPNGRDFSFVSATGMGWGCSAAFGFPSDHILVSCDSTSVIAPGGSAAPIFLTVRPLGPSGTVTNTATVAGGGDAVLTDNTASDATVIVEPVPALPPWALIALTACLALAGVLAMRGRRA